MKKAPIQSRYADIVIQCQQLKSGKTALEMASYLPKILPMMGVKDFALIVHDKDLKEDGTPKGDHMHLVVLYPVDKVKRKSEVLNALADELSDFADKTAISVDLFRHVLLERRLKYLTHSNDEDIEAKKYPYSVTQVVATPFLQEKILKAPFGDNLFQKIYDLIKEGCDNMEIMAEIGMEDYRQYRFNIIDMRQALARHERVSLKEYYLDKILECWRDNRNQGTTELIELIEKINNCVN